VGLSRGAGAGRGGGSGWAARTSRGGNMMRAASCL